MAPYRHRKPMKNLPLPTIEEITQKFDVNPETGSIRYRYQIKSVKPGQEAGTMRQDGYVRIKWGKRALFAHRIIWLVATGSESEKTDHINGVRNDNRISNLRNATNSENMCNHQKRKPVAVYFRGGKWHGRVMKMYRAHRIKPADSRQEAVERVNILRREIHGEFAYQG